MLGISTSMLAVACEIPKILCLVKGGFSGGISNENYEDFANNFGSCP